MRIRRLLPILFLVFISGTLYAQSVLSTRYFDIIYDEEKSAVTATELSTYADDVYTNICTYLGMDIWMKHIPLVIVAPSDTENAYQTNAPYAKILIYDQPFPSLGYWKDTLRGVFTHETFHLVSLNMKGPFLRSIGSVLGDPYTPVYLSLSRSVIEGSAVLYESEGGEGRLNSPLQMAKLLQAKAEGKFPVSYLDITGIRDTRPTGDLTYLFGGAWLKFVRDMYGMEAYRAFLKDCNTMLLPVDFTVWFHKRFGVWPERTWGLFSASVPTISVVQGTDPLAGYGDEVLDSNGRDLLSLESIPGNLLLNGKKISSDETVRGASVNADGSSVLMLITDTDDRYRVRLWKHGSWKTLGVKHVREAMFAGEDVVLLTQNSGEETLVFCDAMGVVQREIPLPADLSLRSLDVLGDGRLLALARWNGKGQFVLLLDVLDGSFVRYPVPDGVEVGSVRTGKDGILLTWAKMGTLSRLAVLNIQDGLVRWQEQDVLGGITQAETVEGIGLVGQGAFFDHTALSVVDESRLTWNTMNVLPERGSLQVPAKVHDRGMPYHAASWLAKGMFLPVVSAVTISGNGFLSLATDGYALGLSRWTSDPMDRLTLLVGSGWNPNDDSLAVVGEASGERWALFGQTSFLESGLSSWALGAGAQIPWNRLVLSNTTWWFGSKKPSGTQSAWHDTLSLGYQGIRRRHEGVHSYGGLSTTASLSFDAQPAMDWSWWNLGLSATVAVPSLLPFHFRQMTVDLPIWWTLSLSPSVYVVLSQSVGCVLYSREIQRGTPVVHLFFRRLNVTLSAEETWLRSFMPENFPLFSPWDIGEKQRSAVLSCTLDTSLNNTALETDSGYLGFSLAYQWGQENPWTFTVLVNLLPSSLS
jgi:hypothetical protein